MTEPEPTPDALRLRALLEDAVADVQPAPALDRIRARTKVTPIRRTRPWFLVTAGAVAATAATITAVTLLNGRSPQAGPDHGPAATTTSQSPLDPATQQPSTGATEKPTPGTTEEPTPAQTDAPSTSGEQPPAGTVLLAVYFVGDTPTGPRLFREFQHETVAAGWTQRLVVALDRAVHGDAVDDDYGTAWPSGSPGVVSANFDEASGKVVITLGQGADLALPPAGSSPDAGRLAVQQLVYTAQAVVKQRVPVVFQGPDGKPLDSLLGVDVSPEVVEAPAIDVQAPVWVAMPQDGEQVGRTFTVEGRGVFFEANVSWQLLRGGQVVKSGFATAEECCTLSPYSFKVTAEPGEYVLRVYAADESGGEGPGEQADTKRITVR